MAAAMLAPPWTKTQWASKSDYTCIVEKVQKQPLNISKMRLRSNIPALNTLTAHFHLTWAWQRCTQSLFPLYTNVSNVLSPLKASTCVCVCVLHCSQKTLWNKAKPLQESLCLASPVPGTTTSTEKDEAQLWAHSQLTAGDKAVRLSDENNTAYS